ncbi:phage tail tube protein [Nitrolancea hollandica]|uniref:Uncharacterized protein n=1 Tax=Nitrolancea hollandica Lb TaxID=1129897 RepID=I4EG35_9BACT|nr:phage tail tube protein [Nitrolancea hollandica]CCF83647.1 hypothetical protein NITHO_2520022 [Nitrolancea hollandica Lb]
MTTGTGKVFGIADESSYATYTAPLKWIEFNSESIKANPQPYEAERLDGRPYQTTNDFRQIIKGAGGDTEFDVTQKGMGKLFLAMLGAVATSQPDVVNMPLEFLHTFTPSRAGWHSKSFSVLKNIPAPDDTDFPFAYAGGVVTKWDLKAALNQALKLTLTWDFMKEFTDKTVGVPSFPTNNLAFIDIDLAIEIDGASSCISELGITEDRPLKTDRWCLGGTKKRPLLNGKAKITGTISKDFEDITLYQKFISGAHAALILTASLGEIDAGKANPFKLVVTVPDIVFTGETPTIGGQDLVQQSLPWTALDNGTDPIITFEYSTSDATP